MLLTLGVKNMFGCIVGFQKARWHMRAGVDKMAFARLLIAIHQAVKPAVSILDGIIGMEGEGPGKRGKPREIGILMGSCDAFALDMAVCKMIGINFENVPILKIAREDNLIGSWEVDGILPSVRNFQLPGNEGLVFGPRFLQNFLRRHTQSLPVGDDLLCRFCGKCRTICPAQAIQLPDGKRIEFDYEKCIRCYCCIEVCPHGVLHAQETAGGKLMRYLTDKFS
jgi:ferredoxin